MTLLAAFLGWMFDGMEMGIFPLVARPALQEMQRAAGVVGEGFVQEWMGIITALFLLGAAAGGCVFGWLGDRIGRVRAMTWSILCYSLLTGACYFATAPWQLGALRFLAALGMGGEWALGVALVMETWPGLRRPWMAGAIGAAANLGFALVALIALTIPITPDSWRWMMLVGAAPALLTFFIRLFVPESEKWRAAVEQKPSHPLRELFVRGLRGRLLVAIGLASVPLIVTWGIVQWIPLWADQMTEGRNPSAKAASQLAQALGATVGCLVAPVLGARLGRRGLYFLLCALALGASLALFHGFRGFTSQFLVVVFLVGATTASFYGWLPLYLPELFPTRVRATGQGVAFNAGRLLAALGAWQMPAVMRSFEGSYPAAGGAIVLVYAVGMTLVWLAPETRGRPLPP
jgi:MFS family permease